MSLAIHIHPADNVAVALQPIAKGTAVALPDLGLTVVAAEGHPPGPQAGRAAHRGGGERRQIRLSHRPRHRRHRARGLGAHPQPGHQPVRHGRIRLPPRRPPAAAADARDVFRLPAGRTAGAAIRNEIWVLPTVGCVNGCAEALARENQDLVTGSIDGLYAFPHPYGCSQTGADHARTRKLLAALARHPHAGGVLVLSLGCENLTPRTV